MSKFFSISVLPSIALAGLAGAFLSAAEPAEARSISCSAKYQGCNRRCAAAAGSQGDWLPCIERTCNRQYDNCVAAGGRGPRRGLMATLKPGPVASGPQTPRGPVNQGPFPLGGVQPKNGGIVPGGMKQNGGIVPSGPVRMSSQGKR
jgi:hypothetical protein